MAETIDVRITGSSDSVVRAVAQANAAMGRLSSGQTRVSRSSQALSGVTQQQTRNLQALGRMAVYASTAAAGLAAYGVGRAIKAGIDFNATMESNQLAFKRFIGSAKEARKFTDQLFEVAKKTPFEFSELTTAARMLMSFGVEAQQTERVLAALGDNIAAMGGNTEHIQRATIALGQMTAKGTVSAEELLQLTEAGVPAYKILADQLNLTSEEVRNIGEQGISADKAIRALTRGMEEQFGGAAAEQARTFSGQMSTLKDNFSQAMGAMTEGLFETLRDDWLPAINDTAARISAIWQRKDITPEQKFERSRQAIVKNLGPLFEELKDAIDEADLPKIFGDALSAAIPVIAEAGGRAGLLFIKSFVEAFAESDLLGKLFLGGLFLKYIGGGAAIAAAGKAIGRRMLEGIAGALAGTAAGEALAGALGGAVGAGAGRRAVQKQGQQLALDLATTAGGGAAAGGAGGLLSKLGGARGLAGAGVRVLGPIGLLVGGAMAAEQAGFNPGGDLSTRVQEMVSEANTALKQIARDWTSMSDTQREAAREYLANLEDIGILTEETMAQVNRALRQRDIRAAKPAGVGIAEAVARDGQLLNKEVRNKIIPSLYEIPKAGRRAAADTALGMSRVLEQQGKLPVGSAKRMRDAITRLFPDMRVKSVDEARKMMRGVAGSSAEMQKRVADALGALGLDVNSVLKAMGVKLISFQVGRAHVTRSTARGPRGAGGFHTGDQRGRFIPGNRPGDRVPIWAEEGEGILNKMAVRAIGGKRAIDALNSQFPRFQGGGMVTGDTDYVPALGFALNKMAGASGRSIFVQSGRRTLAEQRALYARYLAGEGALAAPPNPNAPHVRGIAADITPGRSVFGGMAGKFGLGFTVPSEAWHIELLNAAAAGGARGSAATMALRQLSRIKLQGPRGALRSAGQGALDQAVRSANRYIRRQHRRAMGSFTGISGGGDAAANMRLGREMMLRMWPAGQWPALRELWMRESGWSSTAVNPSSGAYGIPQALGHGHPFNLGDARGQIAWGLRYIKGRYGTPAAALAFHDSHNWYQQGGFIPKGLPKRVSQARARLERLQSRRPAREDIEAATADIKKMREKGWLTSDVRRQLERVKFPQSKAGRKQVRDIRQTEKKSWRDAIKRATRELDKMREQRQEMAPEVKRQRELLRRLSRRLRAGRLRERISGTRGDITGAMAAVTAAGGLSASERAEMMESLTEMRQRSRGLRGQKLARLERTARMLPIFAAQRLAYRTSARIGSAQAAVLGGFLPYMGPYRRGTGPRGLPTDGLYYGHKGEVVTPAGDTALSVYLSGDLRFAERVRAEVLDGRTGRDLDRRMGRAQRVRNVSPGRR